MSLLSTVDEAGDAEEVVEAEDEEVVVEVEVEARASPPSIIHQKSGLHSHLKKRLQ